MAFQINIRIVLIDKSPFLKAPHKMGLCCQACAVASLERSEAIRTPTVQDHLSAESAVRSIF